VERQPDHRSSGDQPVHGFRTRKELVEDGFEAVLSRKPRAMPAIARIFDGEKEAKLIALACSKPPKGRALWHPLRAMAEAAGSDDFTSLWSG
jgi:hypothetical protein